MKLIVHAGLHKAASTSFQLFCASHRAALGEAGVSYPDLGDGEPHHNLIAKLMISGKWDEVVSTIGKAMDRAGGSELLLLSAEDLENCLGNSELALRFEEVVRASGFKELEWHFVLRPPWDYFNSLYAEMSKQGIVTSYPEMLDTVLREGSFSGSNGTTDWYFEFDYARSLKSFDEQTAGHVKTHDFDEFCAGGVGRSFFEELFDGSLPSALVEAYRVGPSGSALNTRANRFKVEYRYLCNSLSTDPSRMRSVKVGMLIPMILARLAKRAKVEKGSKDRFLERFGRGVPDLDLSAP